MRTESRISLQDVDMLSDVFEELLQDHQITRFSAVAEGIVTRLIFCYNFGVRDPVRLKRLTVPFLQKR